MSSELFFSVDIEANGPIPGPHSMLSFGVVALDRDKKVHGTFSRNLLELEGSAGSPDTMAWWAKQPRAIWDACRKDPVDPKLAMLDFNAWVEKLSKETSSVPVCVAYPAGFDFTWIHWYFINFTAHNPFSFSCIDVKTLAMAKLGTQFRQTTKRNMPKSWFKDLPPHEHIALSDALEQGLLFINILNHANP